MRKIFLAQETPTPTATPGPIPPIEDIFACLTPRITGKEPLPRISCFTSTGEATAQTPLQIECIAPRLACMMGLRETAGSFRLGGITKKAKGLTRTKVLGTGNKSGGGIPLGNSNAQQQQRIIRRQKELQRHQQMQRPQQMQRQQTPGAEEKVIVRA